MTDRLAIYLLLAGCVLFAAMLFSEIVPGGGDGPAIAEIPARPEIAAAARREPNARFDELLAQTLARPLFSSTRRPPPAAADDTAADSDLSDTRLTGIVTEPGRRLAIFVPSGAKPLTVTEGETVSGWRIESITPREVSLSGPSGTKTLQPKLDPTLAPPPAPPAQPPVAANAAARPRGQQPAAVPMLPRPGVPPIVPNPPPPRPGQARARR